MKKVLLMLLLILGLTACEGLFGDNKTTTPTTHEHSVSSGFKYDDTNHWQECSSCDELINVTAHVFGDWVEVKPATETEEGLKEKSCECGYSVEETIPTLNPSHTHNPSSEWVKDETGHWNTCDGCEEVLNKDVHTFGDWQQVPGADVNYEERSCNVCGYTESRTTEVVEPNVYYIKGNFNDWSAVDELIVDGDVAYIEYTFAYEDQFKVGCSEWSVKDFGYHFGLINDVTGTEGNNIIIKTPGLYRIEIVNYGTDNEALNVILVKADDTPVVVEKHEYYVLGTMTDWKTSEATKLVVKEDVASITLDLHVNDEFKVATSDWSKEYAYNANLGENFTSNGTNIMVLVAGQYEIKVINYATVDEALEITYLGEIIEEEKVYTLKLAGNDILLTLNTEASGVEYMALDVEASAGDLLEVYVDGVLDSEIKVDGNLDAEHKVKVAGKVSFYVKVLLDGITVYASTPVVEEPVTYYSITINALNWETEGAWYFIYAWDDAITQTVFIETQLLPTPGYYSASISSKLTNIIVIKGLANATNATLDWSIKDEQTIDLEYPGADTNMIVIGINSEGNKDASWNVSHMCEVVPTFDENNHYNVCSICESQFDLEAHTYGDWVEVKPATETEEGTKEKSCKCGHKVEASIPTLEHTHEFDTEWEYDETGHWHKCLGCEEEVSNKNTHTLTEWSKVADNLNQRGCECGYIEEYVILYLRGDNNEWGTTKLVYTGDKASVEAEFSANQGFKIADIAWDTTYELNYYSVNDTSSALVSCGSDNNIILKDSGKYRIEVLGYGTNKAQILITLLEKIEVVEKEYLLTVGNQTVQLAINELSISLEYMAHDVMVNEGDLVTVTLNGEVISITAKEGNNGAIDTESGVMITKTGKADFYLDNNHGLWVEIMNDASVDPEPVSYYSFYVSGIPAGANAYVYYWDSKGTENPSWPGNSMTLMDNNCWLANVPSDVTMIIYSWNNVQTIDLKIEDFNKCYWTITDSYMDSDGRTLYNAVADMSFVDYNPDTPTEPTEKVYDLSVGKEMNKLMKNEANPDEYMALGVSVYIGDTVTVTLNGELINLSLDAYSEGVEVNGESIMINITGTADFYLKVSSSTIYISVKGDETVDPEIPVDPEPVSYYAFYVSGIPANVDAYVYYWDSKGTQNPSWPGNLMTLMDNNCWLANVPSDVTTIIYSWNDVQTPNLIIEDFNKCYWTITDSYLTADGKTFYNAVADTQFIVVDPETPVEPVVETFTFYVNTNGYWLEPGERLVIRAFRDSGASEYWYDMILTDTANVYVAEIDTQYTHYQICRMKPNTTTNNVENRETYKGNFTFGDNTYCEINNMSGGEPNFSWI